MYVLYIKEHAFHGVKQNKKIAFNSVEAARKFMCETMNTPTTKKYLEQLRDNKRIEIEKFSKRESQLYRFYGMIDVPLPAPEKMKQDIQTCGVYMYHIGNAESAFRTVPSLTFTLEPKKDICVV